jgi:hypothetical protein
MLCGVLERLTEPARRVVVLAQDEARSLRHADVGSEHLLLGLLAVREGLAATALASLGVTLEPARVRIAERIGVGDRDSPVAMPFTPRAKRVLTAALDQALSLGDDHIGTRHLLLAVLGEEEAVAASVLRDFGVDLGGARRTVRELPGREAQFSGRLVKPVPDEGVDGADAETGPRVTVHHADSGAFASASQLARAFGSSVLEPTWWPADAAEVSYVLVTSPGSVHYQIGSTRSGGIPISVIGHHEADLGGRTPRDWLYGEWSEPPELAHVRGLIGNVGIPRRLQAAIYDRQLQVQFIGYGTEAEILTAADSLRSVAASGPLT